MNDSATKVNRNRQIYSEQNTNRIENHANGRPFPALVQRRQRKTLPSGLCLQADIHSDVDISETQVRSILTRTSGYLRTISSHSLQPYRGCGLGKSLCGVGCYVQANPWILNGRVWGEFVEARLNAAASYAAGYEKEKRWASRAGGTFGIFMSSSTEPFQPAERKYGVTKAVLAAMIEQPPDELIVQTHSHRVMDAIDLLTTLSERCKLRVHISIESDRETLPGLPPPASPVAKRMAAGAMLRERGLIAVATVAPLLPIESPDVFFAALARAFDAVVIDHFVGGDGSPEGQRTGRTALPLAMARVDPASTSPAYRDAMVSIARRHMAKVGVGIDGFAARYLPETTPE